MTEVIFQDFPGPGIFKDFLGGVGTLDPHFTHGVS